MADTARAVMKIDRAVLREINLPLVHVFETSSWKRRDRRVLLIEVAADGLTGWGECVAQEAPYYCEESVDGAWSVLTQFLLPPLLGAPPLQSPGDACLLWKAIRGNRMAKACVEASLWDLRAHQLGLPLWKLLGGDRERVACGVSIGIQPSVEALLDKIEEELAAGYHRIKLKIGPDRDLELLSAVRRRFPDLPLMVDANGAYGLGQLDHLKRLDEFKLMMIEQPLNHDDLLDHAKLQGEMTTPLCLDESIRHARDAEQACELGSCGVINIKMGRVGGPSEAIRVHDLCQSRGVPVWCGGMLETGIGRAHNIALSTLANFSLPGDISASRRYYQRDTVVPPVEVTSDGYIIAPSSPGLGYQPDLGWIDELTVRSACFE